MIGTNHDDISSSQYLVNVHGVENSSAPHFDLEEEFANQKQVQMLIREGAIKSAHDLSEGGLFVGLLEKGMVTDWALTLLFLLSSARMLCFSERALRASLSP